MDCYICGVELTNETRTFDHVIPKSAGGTKTLPCCSKCNKLKRNLMPSPGVFALIKLASKHLSSNAWAKIEELIGYGYVLYYEGGEVTISGDDIKVTGYNQPFIQLENKLREYIREFNSLDLSAYTSSDRIAALLTILAESGYPHATKVDIAGSPEVSIKFSHKSYVRLVVKQGALTVVHWSLKTSIKSPTETEFKCILDKVNSIARNKSEDLWSSEYPKYKIDLIVSLLTLLQIPDTVKARKLASSLLDLRVL